MTIAALVFSLVTSPIAPPNQLVVVDLSAQRLTAYENGKRVMEFPVSTGRTGKETPTGNFRIKQKQPTGRALPKYGGRRLSYVLRLKGHYLIHGSESVPDYPASNGCVRMRPPDAKKLYDWTRIGTPVEVIVNSDCWL